LPTLWITKKQYKMAKPLVTCLWFDGQAEAAANYYCTVFKDSKITQVTPMVVTFELNGNKFMGLNGGPKFKFDEAVSFMVNCDSQEEIDYYWDTLTKDGGEESVCGWLKDKFGLSWQIVPSNIGELMAEPERAKRVMDVVMQMKKLDMKKMENA
jgi:predicted 3-demethylubiquinone-9 3-methyltransferase (glyoxalase superfamily)